MLNQLLEIAWKSSFLNQAFSVMLLFILIIQIIRNISFRLAVSHWHIGFESYMRELRDKKVTSYALDRQESLIPPQYNQPLWQMLPSILTMLGLLGTFIGLTLSLAVIPFGGETNEILDGVKRALPMMGSAFWTSLSALFASLSIKINQYLLSQFFKRAVLQRLAKLDDPKILSQLEQLAFSKGLSGAFLRDYQLKDVLWQQSQSNQRQLERLGLNISESIKMQSQKIEQLLSLNQIEASKQQGVDLQKKQSTELKYAQVEPSPSLINQNQSPEQELKQLLTHLLKSQISLNQKIDVLMVHQEQQQQKLTALIEILKNKT